MAFLTNLSQYAGIGSSLAGIGLQLSSYFEQQRSIRGFMEAAQAEAAATLREGEAISNAAQANAWAAMRDAADLEDAKNARIRFLRRQGRSLESSIEAHASASGIEFVGSPVLVQAEASLETARAVANEEITAKVGKRKLFFEAEQELIRAENARTGAEITSKSTANLRGQQVRLQKRKATGTLLGGISSTVDLIQNPAVQSLLKGNN